MKITKTTASLILFILVFIAYANSLDGEFVLDDIDTIVNNVQNGSLEWLFTSPAHFLLHVTYYFPRFISYSLGGQTPFFYHIFNLAFHLGTVFVLYLLLLRMWNERHAFMASALYAVHPILTESVAYVSAFIYPQYAFFVIGSLYTYMLSSKKKVYYWLSLVLFAMSLTSHLLAAVLPILLCLYELSFGSIKNNWKRIIPYFVITAVVGGLIMTVPSPATNSLVERPPKDNSQHNPFIKVPYITSSYLRFIVWPDKLTIYHKAELPSNREIALSWLLFSSFLAIIVWSYKKHKNMFFWLMFFCISISPILLPTQRLWFAERYVYLGTIGVVCAVTYGLYQLRKFGKLRKFIDVLFVFLIIALMIRTIVRNNDWNSAENFAYATVKVSPYSSRAYMNLGSYYLEKNEPAKALIEYKKSIEVGPKVIPGYLNVGYRYLALKNYDQAIAYFKKGVELDPTIWHSHYALSLAYYRSGAREKAIIELKKAIELNTQKTKMKEMQDALKQITTQPDSDQ
ncbi:MAG: tetratricopeptide repeat protein [Patescibacteria group bacterium]